VETHESERTVILKMNLLKACFLLNSDPPARDCQ
jgi:hypothetical protein